MDYLQFANNRVLFGILRKSPRSRKHKPCRSACESSPGQGGVHAELIVDYFAKLDHGAEYWALAGLSIYSLI